VVVVAAEAVVMAVVAAAGDVVAAVAVVHSAKERLRALMHPAQRRPKARDWFQTIALAAENREGFKVSIELLARLGPESSSS